MRLHRFLLLCLGVGLLATSVGLGISGNYQRIDNDRDRRLSEQANAQSELVSQYFDRARTLILLTAQNPAFAEFYEAPGTRTDKLTAGGSIVDHMQAALTYLEGLYPADDFNTSVAIAELQRLKGDVNKLLSQGLSTEAQGIAKKEFRSLGEVLGLFKLEQWQFGQMPFRSALATDMPPPILRSRGREISQIIPSSRLLPLMAQSLADAEVQLKVDERNEARKQKNFKKADEIRQSLFATHGIVIEDKPDGTSRWKR